MAQTITHAEESKNVLVRRRNDKLMKRSLEEKKLLFWAQRVDADSIQGISASSHLMHSPSPSTEQNTWNKHGLKNLESCLFDIGHATAI